MRVAIALCLTLLCFLPALADDCTFQQNTDIAGNDIKSVHDIDLVRGFA